MKFSVIVPVYGVEPYLRQCVDSILSKSDSDYEWIIVDDGSTDETATVVQSFRQEQPDLASCFIHKNGRNHTALNTAYFLIIDDYMLVLDSDYQLVPHGCWGDPQRVAKRLVQNGRYTGNPGRELRQ